MAKIQGITIQFGADTSKLFADLQKVDSKLKGTQSELKSVNRLLKFNPKNTELLKQKQTALNNAVNDTKARITELKSALNKMANDSSISRESAQFKAMQREIIATEGRLSALEKKQLEFGSVSIARLKAVGASWQSVGAKIQGAGSKMASTITLWGTIGIFAGKKMVDINEQQVQAENKLTEIYSKRIGAGKKEVEITKGVASALQEQGIYGDELLLQGAQQLATFAGQTSTVNNLLPAMADLLAQQKGYSATAVDAVNVANLMGKVLNGQTGALKRVGISFTEAEAKALKFGTEEEKASVLAKVITNNVGNMNKKFAETDAGKIQNAKNALGDLGERIGAVILPAFAEFAKTFKDSVMPQIEKFIGFMEEHPKLAEFALKALAIAVALAPLVLLVGKIVSVFGGFMSVCATIAPYIATIGGAIMALNPVILLVVAGVAVLGVAIYNLIAHFGEMKAEFLTITNNIKTNFMAIVGIVTKVFSAIANAIKSKIQTAVAIVKSAINKIKSMFNISLKFKDIKMPSFSIKWDKANAKVLKALGLPGMPHLKVNWHADAMKNGLLFNTPTIFSAGGSLHGAGEAGAEMLIGQNHLLSMISTAVYDGMNNAGNNIASAVSTANQLSTAGGGSVNANVYLFKGSPEFGRLIVDTYDTWKGRIG